MIWGENGSGKTSLLEALHILSYGKSFKTSRHIDLIKKGSASYIVRGLYEKNGTSETIDTEHKIKGSQKTKINVDDVAIKMPLAAEARVIANTTSEEDKGLWTTSVIVPIIFPIIKDELECAKLC